MSKYLNNILIHKQNAKKIYLSPKSRHKKILTGKQLEMGVIRIQKPAFFPRQEYLCLLYPAALWQAWH